MKDRDVDFLILEYLKKKGCVSWLLHAAGQLLGSAQLFCRGRNRPRHSSCHYKCPLFNLVPVCNAHERAQLMSAVTARQQAGVIGAEAHSYRAGAGTMMLSLSSDVTARLINRRMVNQCL